MQILFPDYNHNRFTSSCGSHVVNLQKFSEMKIMVILQYISASRTMCDLF